MPVGLVYQIFKGMTGGSTSADGIAIILQVAPGRWLFVLPSQPNGAVFPLSGAGSFDPAQGIPLKDRRDGTLGQALFGPGFALDRLTLRRTDATVNARALVSLSPWLCAQRPLPMQDEFMGWTDAERLLYTLSSPQNFMSHVCPSPL